MLCSSCILTVAILTQIHPGTVFYQILATPDWEHPIKPRNVCNCLAIVFGPSHNVMPDLYVVLFMIHINSTTIEESSALNLVENLVVIPSNNDF